MSSRAIELLGAVRRVDQAPESMARVGSGSEVKVE